MDGLREDTNLPESTAMLIMTSWTISHGVVLVQKEGYKLLDEASDL